ncbi:MAG TPA: cytochrome c [Magnetospirillaceae bacterium]|nr:cytochrome c [Magnetospirillaceae bacterium]
MKRVYGLAAVLAVVIGSGAALALDAPAAIKERQDFYKDIGKSMKGLGEELKSSSPNVADVKKFAANIDAAAPKVPSFFPAGTGPEAGVKTGAKAEIWQKPDEFKKDAADFATAAHALNVAAQSGDVAAIKDATGKLGEACKACHQTFREKEH